MPSAGIAHSIKPTIFFAGLSPSIRSAHGQASWRVAKDKTAPRY